MSNVVNVHDFKTNYSRYLEEAIAGNEVVLGKHGKPVAKLIPLTPHKQPRTPGALKGKVWADDDFDAPLQDLWRSIPDK